MKFPCQRCSACCRQIGMLVTDALLVSQQSGEPEIPEIINLLAEFPYLFDETGACEQLDKEKNRCKVYHRRPEVCRTNWMYNKFFSKLMSKEQYFQQAVESCAKLRQRLVKA